MKRILYIIGIFLFTIFGGVNAQQANPENVKAKGTVTEDSVIKLRWAPASTKAWVEGRRYGYNIERYTIFIDQVLQSEPAKKIIDHGFLPKPLSEWESLLHESDYAAVIAQAFYGEEFELTTSNNDLGSIINQANELEQRFSTSIFMAEYDYLAAELAGWAWCDSTAKVNEKYLYRIILNKPEKEKGDTTVVFISPGERRELPKPIGLNSVNGDKSIMLTWNYHLLSKTYHSYHIERRLLGDFSFSRITEMPVTALNQQMGEFFYTDSLPENNVDYEYRILGVTSFNEEGPHSDTVICKGKDIVVCIPQILGGDYISDKQARIFWEFDCEREDLVRKMQIRRADLPDSDYNLLVDSIPVNRRDFVFDLPDDYNYLKLYTINQDSTIQESFPLLIRRVDSIPPAVPVGLNVVIDSVGIAHLTWDMNKEVDLRGYRVLRSFTKKEEKTSLISEFIPVNYYTDTLSLTLGNSSVYYSLTAVDVRYNESQPSEDVIAIKPTNETPAEPAFTGISQSGAEVTVSWITDKKRSDVTYMLKRVSLLEPELSELLFSGDHTTETYTDKVLESGSFEYIVIATNINGKASESPQRVRANVTLPDELNAVSSFRSYVDRRDMYVELSWAKNSRASFYRIYKAGEDEQLSLWQEVDPSVTRIVDEHLSPATKYRYMIVFITTENRTSKPKELIVNI
jgi:hypothetical protein